MTVVILFDFLFPQSYKLVGCHSCTILIFYFILIFCFSWIHCDPLLLVTSIGWNFFPSLQIHSYRLMLPPELWFHKSYIEACKASGSLIGLWTTLRQFQVLEKLDLVLLFFFLFNVMRFPLTGLFLLVKHTLENSVLIVTSPRNQDIFFVIF